MRALWFESGNMDIRDIIEPVPGPGEVLIKVLSVGICNTDIELRRGYMNFTGVPGHEFVGEVVSERSEFSGLRVVGEINIGCGRCDYCKIGMTRHCVNREVLGIFKKQGAFAQYITLPESNLHEVPEGLSNHDAVLVEPLAAAFRIPEQTHIVPGSRVLLIGDGKLAQMIARVLARYQVRLTIVGRHADKLALMEPFAEAVFFDKDFIVEDRFETVVEASGGPSGLETARKALLPMGTLVLKSTYSDKTEVDLAPFVVDEINIVGSRCGPFGPALDLLAEQSIDAKGLVTGVFPFSEATKAFDAAAEPGAVKEIVDME